MPESDGSGQLDIRADSAADRQYADASKVDSPYARYVLFILVLIYMFNFIDRQILSILANDIKADLGISDAEIGFLYGTAFAVFYAIFGIPLGRLSADRLSHHQTRPYPHPGAGC
jgi:sugar phosphate permease